MKVRRGTDWQPRLNRAPIVLLLAAWLGLFAGSNLAEAQGTLTNGWTHTGAISPAGDADVWTFAANVGDRILVRVGEIAQTGNFAPRLRLNNPVGAQQALVSAAVSAEIAVTATNSGTFTVTVDDALGTATGTYRLTLAKSPGTIFVAPGDEGGPMVNGVAYEGNFLPPGDLDVWTFTASAGDSIVVKMGQMSDTNNFDPWIRLYGPDGALLDSQTDTTTAEVTARATNSGTFTVVVANYPYYSDAANGTYRLTLAKTGAPFAVSAGDEGGPMTNGVAHLGNLPAGDVDMWNFNANAGDSIVIKMGQVTDTNNFDPWIRLYSPEGTLLDSKTAASAAEITVRATNSGTYLVVVDNYPYYSDAASGTYLLTLAKTGDPIVVSPGDDGGPLTNGVAQTGSLPLGDLDLWSFSANSGDAIVIKMGQASDTNNFDPWIRLYGPDGALLDSETAASAAEVTFRATNSGTFLVVVGNYPYYSDAASGTYLLTLAKTGDPIVVSAGDEGGPMTNGVAHQGNLPLGDLDLWNVTAAAGQSIVVRVGQMTDAGNFDPWVRLYGPNGALLASDFGSAVAEVSVRATNSGTFLVVVGNNPYNSDAGSGTYLLTLAKTGDPVVVSPGDEGGVLTNGVAHWGNIPIGDLDAWYFSASAGQGIVVRAGQISETNSFAPWVRLYGPDGSLLGSNFGAAVGEVSTRATNNGVFLVVIGNNDYYNNAGSGTYMLTLAKTGDAVVVSPGDEGGALNGTNFYDGLISIGDLDVYTFTICAGEWIDVRADEITQTNSFAPWVRLYGPTGLLLGSSFGATFGEVARTATNGGTYTVIIGNNDYYNNAGSGTYRLTVNGLSSGLKLCAPVFVGTNVSVSGIGGVTNANYVLFTQTNLLVPFAQWTALPQGQFDQFGVFTRTNLALRSESKRFFRLLEQ